jgi:hypothetical protein
LIQIKFKHSERRMLIQAIDPPQPDGSVMERQQHINLWYVIFAFAAMMVMQYFWVQSQHIENISYSRFEQLLKAGAIKDISISRDTILGALKEPAENEKPHFQVVRIDPGFAETLSQYGVEFKGVAEDTFFSTILSWIIPSVILRRDLDVRGAADGRTRRHGRIDDHRKEQGQGLCGNGHQGHVC